MLLIAPMFLVPDSTIRASHCWVWSRVIQSHWCNRMSFSHAHVDEIIFKSEFETYLISNINLDSGMIWSKMRCTISKAFTLVLLSPTRISHRATEIRAKATCCLLTGSGIALKTWSGFYFFLTFKKMNIIYIFTVIRKAFKKYQINVAYDLDVDKVFKSCHFIYFIHYL